MPRPGSYVIHPRLLDQIRPTVTGTFPDRVRITRPGEGPGTYDPATGKTTPPERTEIYADRARVQAERPEPREVQFGDQEVTLIRYQVSAPWDVPEIRIGDRVEVTESRDPELPGKHLRVQNTTYGSLQVERTLTCQLDLD